MKPFAENVNSIYQARISFNTGVGFSGKPIIKAADAFIDWYKPTYEESVQAARKLAQERQKILDEKLKNGQ